MTKTKFSTTKTLLVLGLIPATCSGLTSLAYAEGGVGATEPVSDSIFICLDGTTIVDNMSDCPEYATLNQTEEQMRANYTQCLVNSYNAENNTALTSLTDAQLAEIKKVDCYQNVYIFDLNKLTNLEEFSMYGVANSSLDFSSNAKLTKLALAATELTSITFPSNHQISDLDLISKIANLDLSALVNLEKLKVYGSATVTLPQTNKLTTLEVGSVSTLVGLSGVPELKNLYITNGTGTLENLDISGNTKLENLIIYGPKISALDLSQNSALKTLAINNSPISSLDLSHNTELTELYVTDTNLSQIDISKNTKLDTLNLGYNNLSSIDTSNNSELTTLLIDGNKLEKLDLSKNTKLTAIGANNNKLTEVNLGDIEISYANFANNDLQYIDLSKAKEEAHINLSGNKNLQIVAVPKSWEGEYTEEEIHVLLNLDENQNITVQYGALKVPKTGVAISEMAKYAAIVALPTILMLAAISKNFAKARSKRVRFSR